MAGPDNAHLAAMRVEYGSVEKDGSPDLDVDWLDDGWLALLRRWIDDAEHAGIAEPNAMVLATVELGKTGQPVGTLQGRRRGRHHVLHELRFGQRRRARRDAVRVGDLSLVLAEQTGPYPRAGDQGRLSRPATTTGRSGRAVRSWAPGRRINPGRSRPGRRWLISSQRSRPASPTPSTSRCRRTGAATASRPTRSNSGRAEKTGCTTEFV